METRQRSKQQSSDLPPKRQGKVVRHDVSKPLQHVSLSRVVHLLTIFAILFTAFYAYRLFQWKTEVGGWWNLALGKRPPPHLYANPAHAHRPKSGTETKQDSDVALESHIHAVASILGMQPTDLASALHSAVHQHVAPKTISSLSSSASSSASFARTTAPLASILFDSAEDLGEATPASYSGGMADKAGTVAQAVEAVVGLEEPAMG